MTHQWRWAIAATGVVRSIAFADGRPMPSGAAVAGGAVGMGPMDWFDLLMHGSPWLLLIGVGIHHIVESNRPNCAGHVLHDDGAAKRRLCPGHLHVIFVARI